MTGDRVWRMPVFEHYTKQINESQLADLNNIGKHGRSVPCFDKIRIHQCRKFRLNISYIRDLTDSLEC